MLLMRNSLLLILCSSIMLHAFESAHDCFNEAAQTYILKNRGKEALKIIEEGLVQFPSDPQLMKLAEKIKEEEQKKEQQKQQEKQNNDNNNENKEEQEDKKQDQQDQQDKQDDKQEQDKKEQQQNQDNEDQKGDDEKQQQPQQPQQPQQSEEEMKKEEARRIIELYADDADSLNKPIQKKLGKQFQPEKDW